MILMIMLLAWSLLKMTRNEFELRLLLLGWDKIGNARWDRNIETIIFMLTSRKMSLYYIPHSNNPKVQWQQFACYEDFLDKVK